MDCRTGEIVTKEQVLAKMDGDRRYFKEMLIPPTPLQTRHGRVGRNEPCPCGSGKKFKKCCLVRIEEAALAP